jgi:hypothetical protein
MVLVSAYRSFALVTYRVRLDVPSLRPVPREDRQPEGLGHEPAKFLGLGYLV